MIGLREKKTTILTSHAKKNVSMELSYNADRKGKTIPPFQKTAIHKVKTCLPETPETLFFDIYPTPNENLCIHA